MQFSRPVFAVTLNNPGAGSILVLPLRCASKGHQYNGVVMGNYPIDRACQEGYFYRLKKRGGNTAYERNRYASL
jgi:hypothetical protein